MNINATTDQIDAFLQDYGFQLLESEDSAGEPATCFTRSDGRRPQDEDESDGHWSRTQAFAAIVGREIPFPDTTTVLVRV